MSEQIFAMPQMNPQPTPEVQEEFLLLLSLRLDNLLDSAEEKQFQEMIHFYPACALAWGHWRRLHQQLVAEPAVEPPANFVQNVESCLLQQDRRGRLWQGLLIGLFVVLLWGGLLATTVGLGAYMVFNQSNLLGDLIRNLAIFSSTVSQWLTTLRTALDAFVATPQATALAICYLALAAVMLSFWIRFLRRTVAEPEAVSAV
jgi:hypothetical protein